jgi:hypothetical protein
VLEQAEAKSNKKREEPNDKTDCRIEIGEAASLLACYYHLLRLMTLKHPSWTNLRANNSPVFFKPGK